MRGIVVGVVGVLLLCGCSGQLGAEEVISVTTGFVRADAAQRCRMLAPQTAKNVAGEPGGCEEAMRQLVFASGAATRGVEVAGESAQVRLADQAVFLARFPEGWKVTAAGCVRDDPDPAVPYECEVRP